MQHEFVNILAKLCNNEFQFCCHQLHDEYSITRKTVKLCNNKRNILFQAPIYSLIKNITLIKSQLTTSHFCNNVNNLITISFSKPSDVSFLSLQTIALTALIFSGYTNIANKLFRHLFLRCLVDGMNNIEQFTPCQQLFARQKIISC